jgi:hypothetical protein
MLSALFSWPGVSRRAISWLLPDGAPRRALVLDGGFLRPLRALGHTVVTTGEKAELVCARMPLNQPGPALIEAVKGYADAVSDGGMVIVRSAPGQREHVAAAFLHAGLRDVEQARIGRGFLTSGWR